MRLPAQLDIGPYTIHLDVLATRLLRQRQRIRRWSLALFSGAVTLLTMRVLAWGLIPWLHGTGTVVFAAYPNDTTLSLDGQPLVLSVDQVTVRAGEHTVEARRAGAFPVTLPLSVTRNQTVTLTLPPLRPIPIVQAVALPASDATWQQVGSDAGGGWRITARAPLTAAAQPGWGPTAAEAATRYVLHLDAAGLTRQSVLETYPIADEIVTPRGERYWAAWEPT